MTKCGKCGAVLDGTEKFCASCGQPTGFASNPGSRPAIPAAASSSSILADPGAASRPAAVAASKLLELGELKDAAPPVSSVNPFAATAPPGSRLPGAAGSSPALKAIDAASLAANPVAVSPKPDTRPPPQSEAPTASPRVSPLAMSNGISGPTPFSEALQKARDALNTPLPSAAVKPEEQLPPKPKKQGTQIMATAPRMPPAAKKDAPKKNVPKTVAMDFNPRAQPPVPTPAPTHPVPAPSSRANAAPQSVAPGSMPQSVPPAAFQPQQGMPQSVPPGGMPQSAPPGGMPQSVLGANMGMPNSVGMPPGSGGMPNSVGMPPGSVGMAPSGPRQFPSSTGNPAQPQPPPQSYGGYPPYPQPPPQQAPWQQPPPQYQAYGFGYQPGARVQVTWSNGQRYPATVTQITGSQCLVVFPDGQQHWVEMQYLSPG